MNELNKMADSLKESSPTKDGATPPVVWEGDDMWIDDDMMEELDSLNAMLLEASVMVSPKHTHQFTTIKRWVDQ